MTNRKKNFTKCIDHNLNLKQVKKMEVDIVNSKGQLGMKVIFKYIIKYNN